MAFKKYPEVQVATEVAIAAASIIDSAPAALDTLNELAAALGDDANYAATVTTALGNKQDKVSGVSDTEIGYLNGVTSAIQTQLDDLANATPADGADGADGQDGAGYDYVLPTNADSYDFPLNFSIPPFIGDTYPIPAVGGAYKVGNSIRFYINPDENADAWVGGEIVSFDGTTANIEYYAWSDSAPYTGGAVGSLAIILPYMTLVGKPGASGVPTAVEVSSDIVLEFGNRYFVDTTAARTLTLPATPALGDEIQIFDATGNAGTNNITVLNNSLKINGVTDSALLDSNGVAAAFIYTGSTYGWRLG
jgi:hypothetical protein